MTLSGVYAFDAHFYDVDVESTGDDHSVSTAQDAEVNINMRGELDSGILASHPEVWFEGDRVERHEAVDDLAGGAGGAG